MLFSFGRSCFFSFFFFSPLFSPFPSHFVLFFSEGENGEAEKDRCLDLFLLHLVQRFIPGIEGESNGEENGHSHCIINSYFSLSLLSIART